MKEQYEPRAQEWVYALSSSTFYKIKINFYTIAKCNGYQCLAFIEKEVKKMTTAMVQ